MMSTLFALVALSGSVPLDDPCGAETTHCAAMADSNTATEAGEPRPEAAPTFATALRKGTWSANLRYRFERVDDSAPSAVGPNLEVAHASTLRSQIAFASLPWHGFSLKFAFTNVSVLGNDSYNNVGAGSLRNSQSTRAVVADPKLTEVAQVHLDFQPNDQLSLRLGRQEISFGQQRFIGAVAWRQNHQEFDALRVDWQPKDHMRVSAAYLDRIHTVTGATQETSSTLLNVNIPLKALNLTAYGYWLDYEAAALHGRSNATVGLRAAGSFRSESLHYQLEVARQTDHADRPAEFSADYYRAQLKWAPRANLPTVEVATEVLGSDNSVGFQTPLATLHKFNGFADRFLVTPSSGLRDTWLRSSFGKATWTTTLTFHDFEADEGASKDYGTEWNLVLTKKIQDQLTIAAKVALYEADSFSHDTEKLMLWAAWSF